ncbi:hypothetical protein P3W45_000474 [Vairimorpha bombi]|jgi:D-aminoacyl-tRNA deacylase
MRLVIQKVEKCQVEYENKIIREINQGCVVYIGIEKYDEPDYIKECTSWLINYVTEHNKDVLLLSQFTLFASFKSKKPDFHRAMRNQQASSIFNGIVEEVRSNCKCKVESGLFGEYLLINYTSKHFETFFIDFNKKG